MLTAQRRDPRVVRRDRRASLFQLAAKIGIPRRGLLIDLEHLGERKHLFQPPLVLAPVPRPHDSEAILAQDDDRNGNLSGARKRAGGAPLACSNGGKRVCIEDQARSSGSILSNSPSINALIRAVSLRRWRRLPASRIRVSA